MDTPTLATNLEEWAAEVLGINTFDHMADSLDKQLPLVVCEMQTDRRAVSDPQLPGVGSYQQTLIRARRAELLLMFSPDDSQLATNTLQGYVDQLGAALKREPTLGGRVHTASAFYEASYNPPLVRHEDGTIARAARFQFTIGEPQEA